MKIIGFIIIAVLNLAASAQEVIPLYKGAIPGNLNVADKETFLHPQTGRPSVINVTNPTLTVFVPEHQNASHSAVIICPGGGYVRLTIEDGGYEAAKTFAAAGITAFVLKYRTWKDSTFSNYRDIPLQDLEQALSIVHNVAAKWNIDPNHIGLLGFSAGGHLVTMGATSEKGIKPAFTILAYPVISFTDSLVSKTLKSRNTLLGNNFTQKDKETFSPELHISSTTPPAFLVHAEDDSTSMVNNSIVYYRALLANKVHAQLQIYQKGGHGFAMYNKAQDEYWFPAALKWLELNNFYKSEPVKVSVSSAPPFWNDIIAFKKQDSIQPVPSNSILFVGSSSFTKWKDVNNYFPGYTIVNRGFGGSILVDVIRYAYDIIIPYKPKQVVIYCGENDLASADNISAEEAVHRFKTLFFIIRENLPNTIISFVSIKPSPSREKIQERVKLANKQIMMFLKTQKNAQFINVYNAMLDAKGNMREELYLQDRLHMKPEGYTIWKKIITPYLAK